jgi:hypothetical protein
VKYLKECVLKAILGRFKRVPGDPCFHMLFRDKSIVSDLKICGLKGILGYCTFEFSDACFHICC